MATTNNDCSRTKRYRFHSHLLWKLHMGYDLYPKIPIKEDMKIAELRIGIGIWTFDLANNLPSSVQLHGFDISDGQFPHEDHWSHNVHLGLLDLCGLVMFARETWDHCSITHLFFCVSIFNDYNLYGTDYSPEPGGYVQWEDADLVNQVVTRTKGKTFEQMLGREDPRHLNEARFNVINSESGVFKGNIAHLCRNTYLLPLQEILGGLKRTNPPALAPPISLREEALKCLFAEEKKGMLYNWSPVMVLAQKQQPY